MSPVAGSGNYTYQWVTTISNRPLLIINDGGTFLLYRSFVFSYLICVQLSFHKDKIIVNRIPLLTVSTVQARVANDLSILSTIRN